jgi:hypothetical protein
MVDGPVARADGADGEGGHGDDVDVLPALARPEDEEAVVAVGDDAGHEHDADHPGGGKGREEPEGEERTAPELGGGRQAGLHAAAAHAHAREPVAGVVEAALHLVGAVRHQHQPEGDAQHEQREIGVVHGT